MTVSGGRAWVMVLCLFALSFVISGTASGQSAATLTGRVVDSSGAALPGAAVTLSRTGGAPVRTVFTSDAGLFTVAGLSSGEYTVAVELAGFRALSRPIVLGFEPNRAPPCRGVAGVHLAGPCGRRGHPVA